MKQRIFTAILILTVSLLVVGFSGYIIYPIAISILAVIGVFEILRVMKSHKHFAFSIPAYILAALFPILPFFTTEEDVGGFLLILAGSMFVYLIWIMGVAIFSKGKIPFSRIAEVFTSVVYVTVSFTALSLLRYINRGSGVFAVVLVFVVAWICDVFAYLVGVTIGKHKLIPEISPKKTVEGSIGGILFTALFCGLYGLGLDLIMENMTVNYPVLIIGGAILSVVSQLGDLVASLIKREYDVKDYSRIFPGHGGVMDRFDSVLSVSTALLIIFIIYPPFVMN